MSVSAKRFVLLGVAALLTLFAIGCDSLPGFEGCPGEVQTVSTPSDLVLYIGEENATTTLPGLFAHTQERSLSYSAKSSVNNIVEVEAHGTDTLKIDFLPLRVGEAQIEIEAKDACGQSQTASFKIEVVDICTLVSEGAYDPYFPVNVGNTWTYNYQSDTQGTHPHYQTTGTLQWELTSATACENGILSFAIQETFEGVTTLPSDNPDYREERSWIKMLAGEIKGNSLHLEGYTEELAVQWAYPPSSPDTVATEASVGTRYPYYSESSSVVLRRETGITRWYTGYSAVHNEYSSTRITLDQ